ncbi:MAG: DivIVA domain-containing protein [Longicatena sp.]|jgi:DivIVA domain-containing protein|nr:DivIVA domain-containing protein [Longicatena sp.]
MESRFNLNTDDLLNKQFNVDFKGYSAIEVDHFLDLVIADYQAYDALIESLGTRLQEAENMIKELKAQNVILEAKAQGEEKPVVVDHVDILKRLTNLENAVFGKDE